MTRSDAAGTRSAGWPRVRSATRWVPAGLLLALLVAVPGTLLVRSAVQPDPGRPRPPTVPVARDVRPAAPTWGGRHAWPDGLSVSVSAPVPCTPAPDAAPARVDRAVKFRMTVVNRGREPFDTGQFTVFDEASFDGRGAEPVIDTNGPCGNGGLDAVPVLPGRSVGYDLSYAVGPRPGLMRLTFQPGIGATPVVFAGRA